MCVGRCMYAHMHCTCTHTQILPRDGIAEFCVHANGCATCLSEKFMNSPEQFQYNTWLYLTSHFCKPSILITVVFICLSMITKVVEHLSTYFISQFLLRNACLCFWPMFLLIDLSSANCGSSVYISDISPLVSFTYGKDLNCSLWCVFLLSEYFLVNKHLQF